MAKTLPPAKKVPGRVYKTFNPGPQKQGYDPGDVLQVGKGQVAKFSRGLGWYATAAPKKPTVQVTRTATPQSGFTSIETPAQIEARVRRMAQAAYDRQKSTLDLEAERMRKEAEGRRLGMIAAYQAAGQQNADMSGTMQNGWNLAADKIQGLANTTTGGIAEKLQGDLALQEQALSRSELRDRIRRHLAGGG